MCLLAVTPACSTLGEPGSFPDAYPHGGTGQVRRLTKDELGIQDGRALSIASTAQDAAMVADGHLFYAAAPLSETAPPVPEDFPENEIYWDEFDARAIHRSPPRDNYGFSPGTVVLEASASWEGSEVYDPWVAVDDDGRARLYYAAEGGIGVAEAPSVEGTFARVGDGPILGADAALNGVPRSPSVVRGVDGAWWMYYDAGGAIGVARSTDGVAFARMDGDPGTPAMDPISFSGDDMRTSPEVSVGAPGAVNVTTPVGRHLIRMYFESRREDGTVLAYVAGSEDGVAFERYTVPVAAEDDVRFLAPVIIDDRITVLYANVPRTSAGLQMRALVGFVSPAGASLAPEE